MCLTTFRLTLVVLCLTSVVPYAVGDHYCTWRDGLRTFCVNKRFLYWGKIRIKCWNGYCLPDADGHCRCIVGWGPGGHRGDSDIQL